MANAKQELNSNRSRLQIHRISAPISAMAFHLGKPILIMSLFSFVGGAWFSLHRDPIRRGLTVWVFAQPQYNEYSNVLCKSIQQKLKIYFNANLNADFHVDFHVDLISARAMNMRLPVLFMAPGQSREMPDAVEIEIGSFGRYLRPPVNEVGFLPLNAYLQSSGERWIDRLLPNRLASSTKGGLIFGLPHDVHPVGLAFRDDLFRQAGVPLLDDAGQSTVTTWPQFQDKALVFQNYWHGRGYATRHAIELPQAGAGMLSILLLQRRINLVDGQNRIHINDPKVARTLAFYVRLVAGDRRIAAESAPDSGLEYNDLAEGNLCSLLMPDWRVEVSAAILPAIIRGDADDPFAPLRSRRRSNGLVRRNAHLHSAWLPKP